MDDSKLLWTVHSRKSICHTPVFDVLAQEETAADGWHSKYDNIELDKARKASEVSE